MRTSDLRDSFMPRNRLCRWCIGAAAVIAAAGCQTADYRISLDEFLAGEQAAASPVELPSPETTQRAASAFSLYRVGTGDVLEVKTIGGGGEEIYPIMNIRVGRDGTIDLPNLEPLKVGDMELEDVERTIKSAYVPNVHRELVVNVMPLSVNTTKVLVVGAVTEPGLIALRRTDRNVLFAIVGAGGVTGIASGQATLRRLSDAESEETYDLTDPAQLQAALAAPPLEHGDIIEVHAATPNTVFVGGLVRVIGPQTYEDRGRVNLLQALAAAGGLREDVGPKEGTLVRRLPDGSDVHVKLDLERLACGLDPNLTLAAGDILWVPQTFETRVRDFINRNIFLRAGVSVNYNVTGVEFLNRGSAQARSLSGGGGLQDSFDPLGFLTQNAALQSLTGP